MAAGMRHKTTRGATVVGVLAGLILLAGTRAPVLAAPIVFDFNTLADGASNTKVQQYMQSVILAELGLANGVTVAGSKAEKNYTGDNHVVGPVVGNVVTSLTLGNSDFGIQHPLPYDTFLVNSDSIKITMLFAFPIYNVSFDYEIFPNGSCADPNANYPTPKGNCSVWPDFTFKAGNSVSTSTILYATSQDPSVASYVGYTHSPISGAINKEKAPQLLATSGTFVFPNGVTKLEFYDWPEQIGIDNLTVNQVPEPGILLLLGVGLGRACLRRKHKTDV
jgi:hypothetical protein